MEPVGQPTTHKTKTEIIIGVLLVTIFILATVIVQMKLSQNQASPTTETNEKGEATRTSMSPSAMENVKVPEKGETAPPGVAVPSLVAPSKSGAVTKLRVFDVQASRNAFSPEKIIVHTGDTVVMNVTPTDHAYDFTQPDFGFRAVPLPKGKTTKITLDATASGDFLFFCSTCTSTPKPQGHIVIVP